MQGVFRGQEVIIVPRRHWRFREYRHGGALNGFSKRPLGRIPAPASRAPDFEKEHALRLLQAAEGDWVLAAC